MSWLRRWAWWLVTRCSWCGARHRSDDVVTTRLVSAPGHLYHGDCAAFAVAHMSCLCRSPLIHLGRGSGLCAICRKRRDVPQDVGLEGRSEQWLDAYRLLAARPWGDRNVWTYARFQKALHGEAEAEWLRSR